MNPMENNTKSRVSPWIAEADDLQRKLILAASDAPSRLLWRVMTRLVPSDFLDGQLGEQFAFLREQWFARNSYPSTSSPVQDYPFSAKMLDDMIDRLAFLSGVIRMAPLLRQSAQEIEKDISCYAEKLEMLNCEITAEMSRIAILKAEPDMWRTSGEQLVDLVEKVERCYEGRNGISEQKMGWADLATLNAIIGELRPGRFYLLGAAPGEGKTAFLAGLARAAALTKHNAGIISLRDASESMSLRLLSGESQVDPVDIHTGKKPNQFLQITKAAPKLADFFPAIASLSEATIGEICSFIRQFCAVKGLEVILIDDLDECATPSDEDNAPLFERINQIRRLARVLDLPIVGTVAIDSRGVLKPNESKERTIAEALRFSKADVVAFLRQTEGDDFPIHEFQIVRNALGATATVTLFFNKLTQRFYEVAP